MLYAEDFSSNVKWLLKRTPLIFQPYHEIELDVSYNFIYSFSMLASNVPGKP